MTSSVHVPAISEAILKTCLSATTQSSILAGSKLLPLSPPQMKLPVCLSPPLLWKRKSKGNVFAIPLSSRKAEHRFVLVASPERKEALFRHCPALQCVGSVWSMLTPCVSASACGLSSCVVRVRVLQYTHLASLNNSDGWYWYQSVDTSDSSATFVGTGNSMLYCLKTNNTVSHALNTWC